MEQAKRFYEKLIELPNEVIANPALFGSFTKAVFYAGNKNYNESNQYFEESIEVAKKHWSRYRSLAKKCLLLNSNKARTD